MVPNLQYVQTGRFLGPSLSPKSSTSHKNKKSHEVAGFNPKDLRGLYTVCLKGIDLLLLLSRVWSPSWARCKRYFSVFDFICQEILDASFMKEEKGCFLLLWGFGC
jgi:hypothetical protein